MSQILQNASLPLVLAIAASIGYVIGKWRRKATEVRQTSARRELKRARKVISTLEHIATELNGSLDSHQQSLSAFRTRLKEIGGPEDMASWHELSSEADRLLEPTTQLATQLATSYDALRQQMNTLMMFTELRVDPLTGLNHRRALDDALKNAFAMQSRYGVQFCVAMIDIDNFKSVNDQHGHLHGDRVLQSVAKLLDNRTRETDGVFRYGGEEFVILMPETALEDASKFCEQLRCEAEQQNNTAISIGVTSALDGDNENSLIDRADSAMYQAKENGRNQVFFHDGFRANPAAALSADSTEKSGEFCERRATEHAETVEVPAV